MSKIESLQQQQKQRQYFVAARIVLCLECGTKQKILRTQQRNLNTVVEEKKDEEEASVR